MRSRGRSTRGPWTSRPPRRESISSSSRSPTPWRRSARARPTSSRWEPAVADKPEPTLEWGGGCPDCAQRKVDPQDPLPAVGDDFDWQIRDFDGFRAFMLQELMAHYPQRTRWTSADLEVV